MVLVRDAYGPLRMVLPSGLHAMEERHARLTTLGKCRSQPPRRQVHSHSARHRSSEISPQAGGAPHARSEAEGRSKRNRHLALAESMT